MTIELSGLSPAEKQYYLQHAIAPRPIAFASTVDSQGHINLSPFSFFNLFSSNPPILVFSPSRRVRDNSAKHTLENVLAVPEVGISIVTYDMVQQMSLSSCEYPQGVNEFVKAGFTEQASLHIKPPVVKESLIKMECRVLEVKPLGSEGGAGNLVICEVICMHIDDRILGTDGKIDQRNLHHVARLGGDWYCKVDESNLFQVPKPNVKLGIGIDALPEAVRNSTILTGNNLGQLANVHTYPEIDPSFDDKDLKQVIQYFSNAPEEMEKELHRLAKKLLDRNDVDAAWQVLLAGAQ